MDVHDAPLEAGHEGRREDAHEAGEADEVGARRFDVPGEALLVRGARFSRHDVPRAAARRPQRAGLLEARGVRAVGEDENDPRGQLAARAGRREGLEVRAATREEDREARREREPGDGRERTGRRPRRSREADAARAALDPPDREGPSRPPRASRRVTSATRAGATKRTIPTPQLKTRSISSSRDAPLLRE